MADGIICSPGLAPKLEFSIHKTLSLSLLDCKIAIVISDHCYRVVMKITLSTVQVVSSTRQSGPRGAWFVSASFKVADS